MAGRPEHDVAILGGGLAGLSLAVRLAEIPGCRTVVVEPRTVFRRDRTWCSWRLGPHPFRDAVAASWTRWEVMRDGAGDRGRAVQSCPALPYDMIPADRLYAAALQRLERASNVGLRRGCTAFALSESGDRVQVETSGGPVEAALVFDSRPPPARPGSLVQRFLGQEIETGHPVFDPGMATLMDFRVPQQPDCVHFLYVLPTSPTRALVEDTWFASAGAALPDHRAAIRDYLAGRFDARDCAVRFEEEGHIPMDPELRAPVSKGSRIVPIGTAGGAVKPSSGYAFMAIQRMTDALAADVAAGRPPRPVQPRSPVASWLDAVFLAAIRAAPADAPRIFWSLFSGCPAEPLVRFLNDVGSPADTARVVAVTPKLPMLRAAGALALRQASRPARA